MSAQDNADRLRVGYIEGTHGVHGTVRVHLFDATSSVKPGMEFVLVPREGGAEVARAKVKAAAVIPGKNARARVDLEGVTTRDQADAIRGLSIEVARAELPALEEDEFYLADAIGLRVERTLDDGGTQALGKVVAVTTNGAQDLFEIEFRNAKGRASTWLIPVLPGFVKDVDDARVLVDPPQGLLPDELEGS